MRVGVVAEGLGDFAVLRCILKAVLGLDAAQVDPLRPELQTDETSRAERPAELFSNWRIVKDECQNFMDGCIGTYLEIEQSLEEKRLVVVHIDTAECELSGYDVVRPERSNPAYVSLCRAAVANAMSDWRQGSNSNRIVDAVAVEETDAWLLSHYSERAPSTDTGGIANPKERLLRELQNTSEFTAKDRTRMLRSDALAKYTVLAKPLSKAKTLRKCASSNASLRLFLIELCEKAEQAEPGISLVDVVALRGDAE